MENNNQQPIPMNKADNKDRIKKSIILLSILLVLIAGIVVSIIYIPRGLNSLASVSLSSIFKPKDKISVSADKTALASGDLVTLSWTGPVHEDGTYTISYPCKDGITARFHSGEIMTCDVPFYFSSPDNTASVRIYSTLNRNTDVPLYLNFKNNDGVTSLVGDTLVTVGDTAVATINKPVVVINKPVITPAKTTNTNTATKTITTNRPVTTTVRGVDLEARVIDIGYVSPSNTFTSGITIPAGSKPALRFQVKNIGSGVSGGWTFKATTPSPTTPVFISGIQASLASGDLIEYTLGFDNSSTGGQVIISVNEDNRIKEANYTNNVITYKVAGTNSNSNSVATTTAGKDLSVRISAIGYMSNGIFVEASSTPANARGTIKFVITNAGNQNIDSYTWTANLPSSTDSTYTSSSLSLDAGKSQEFVLGFDNIKSGTNAATITVDSNNSVSETSEVNNIATINIIGY